MKKSLKFFEAGNVDKCDVVKRVCLDFQKAFSGVLTLLSEEKLREQSCSISKREGQREILLLYSNNERLERR